MHRTLAGAGGAAAPALRLLFLLAVLLGVGAMHTLGHFEGHAGHAETAAHGAGASDDDPHSAAAQGPATTGLAAPGHGEPATAGRTPGAAGAEGVEDPGSTGEQHAQPSAAGADDGGLPPLDPASVCLALAGLALAALHLAISALPRTPAPAAAPVRGGRTRAPSAERPPIPPSLSELQVLRI